MTEIVHREALYLSYYLGIQIRQIAPYWLAGIVIGSSVSVFAKKKIQDFFLFLRKKRLGIFGVVPASLLGIASPICMFGTIPIVAAFSARGMRDDWVASFMMSSMLLNPQLLVYSSALGPEMLALRLLFCFLGGVAAGVCVRAFFRRKPFFSFPDMDGPQNRDTALNPAVRLFLNMWRNVKATGPAFLVGIALAALYQRYVPESAVGRLFGGDMRGYGVLLAATLGVPLYVCGGGTIPLLAEWLAHGMSPGSAVAFMLSGPATKITNLSALKAVFTARRFALYICFVFAFALASGTLVNLIF